jgi:hypothetical protein
MSGELLQSLVNLSGLRPKPPHPVACIGAYIGRMDAKNYCWEIKSTLRGECQTQLYAQIQDCLQDYFGSVPNTDRITISFYMIGKSPQTAAPTIVFISENCELRKNARKVFKASDILSHYPAFKTAHSAKDPGFQKMEQLASNPCFTPYRYMSATGLEQLRVGMEQNTFNDSSTDFSLNYEDSPALFGRGESSTWDIENNKTSALQIIKQPATAITLENVGFGAKQVTKAWYNVAQPVRTSGMTLYVRHPFFTRTATANAIQLNDRIYFQTAFHPFLENSSCESEPSSEDDEFEIDSDTDTDNERNDSIDQDTIMTSIGSITPDMPAQSPEIGSGSSRCSSELHRLSDISSEGLDHSSNPLCVASDKLAAFTTTQSTHGLPENAVPDFKSLSILGRIVAGSINTDWALIEIENPEIEAALKEGMNGHAITMDNFAQLPRDSVDVRTSTASRGPLTGVLSAWPSLTRLPRGNTIQKVYVIRLNGALTDGDCGSVVFGINDDHVYGHLVGGCRQTGYAYIMAASEVAKVIRTLEDHREAPFNESVRWTMANKTMIELDTMLAPFKNIDTLLAPTSTSAPADQRRLTCPHGCSRTFSRAFEFRRHMTTHDKPAFRCVEAGCSRVFCRRDKLRNHLRQRHRLDL